MTGEERSGEACPVCSEHRLQLLYFPDVGVMGTRPYDDMLGFGDVKPDREPGIGCAACGSEWATLADFRAAQSGEDVQMADDETG